MAQEAFSIEVIGAEKVAHDLDQVEDRMIDHSSAYREVQTLLESTHARHFARLRGRYVLTGATRASLTQPNANGAIRELHGQSLHFGSRTLPAAVLSKAPRDPNSGQVRKRSGYLSAVLVFSRTTKRKISRIIADYVTEPYG